MASIRISALLTLGILVVYYMLRLLKPQNDLFIAPSLLLPILAIVLGALSGILAATAANRKKQRIWLALLMGVTLLDILGPIVAAFILRDHPDPFVILSMIFILLTPLSAWIYSSSTDLST